MSVRNMYFEYEKAYYVYGKLYDDQLQFQSDLYYSMR